MTKSELIREIAAKTDMTQKKTLEVVNAFCETVEEALVAGERIAIPGFAAFDTKEVEAREMVQQLGEKAGETIVIPAHRKVVVKVSKAIKEAVR